RASRPARDPRGPLRHALDDRHQPGAHEQVARPHRRAHPRRRPLRPPPPQRPPPRAKGPLPPQPQGGEVGPLTCATTSFVAAAITIRDPGDHDAAVSVITMRVLPTASASYVFSLSTTGRRLR